MLIKQIELNQYKRFFLNDIKNLTYSPDKRIQIILGTNGSGKSSLLKELTPLPANITKEYNDDGYKHITIDHNDNLYELISGKDGKNKHSFIVNGKELNESKLKTLQLELVKTHFNLTPDIHNVLTGLKTFPNMSNNERKNWFLNMGVNDYTYPMSVYNKLSTSHRDIIGGIKIINNKLLTEERTLLKPEVINKLETDHSYYIKLLEHVLSLKVNLNLQDSRNFKNEFDISTKKLESVLNNVPANLSKDIVIKNNTNLQLKLNSLQTKKENALQQISELSKLIPDIDDDMEILEKEKDKLTSKINAIKNANYLDVSDIYLTKLNNAVSNVYSYLSGLFVSLSGYDDVIMSREEMDSRINNLENMIKEQSDNETEMRHLLEHKNHYEKLLNNEDIVCPSCNFKWKKGYDKIEHEKIVINLSKRNDRFVKNEIEIKEQKKIIDRIKDRYEITVKIKLLFIEQQTLEPIEKYLFSKYDLLNNYKPLTDKLYLLHKDLQEWSLIDTYFNDMIMVESKIKELRKYNTSNTKLYTDKQKTLESYLHDVMSDIKTTQETIQQNNNYLNIFNRIETTLANHKQLIKEYYKTKDKEIINIRNDYLNQIITFIKSEISNIEVKIKESVYKNERVKSYKKEIEELNEQKKVLGMLIKELSPTEGLIAKSIKSFLESFTTEMNEIINTVWNYGIQVLPCKLDSGNDLDYKFPVLVDDRNIIEDVSKTSSSMQEIISLAFKIVSMRKLKLQDYPLFLDEFGKSMDSKHRDKAYAIVDSLHLTDFKQIFIVSHYEGFYGRFVNSDVNVISPKNLTLDTINNYNKVMLIK